MREISGGRPGLREKSIPSRRRLGPLQDRTDSPEVRRCSETGRTARSSDCQLLLGSQCLGIGVAMDQRLGWAWWANAGYTAK